MSDHPALKRVARKNRYLSTAKLSDGESRNSEVSELKRCVRQRGILAEHPLRDQPTRSTSNSSAPASSTMRSLQKPLSRVRDYGCSTVHTEQDYQGAS
jgi:hypothetical protein